MYFYFFFALLLISFISVVHLLQVMSQYITSSVHGYMRFTLCVVHSIGFDKHMYNYLYPQDNTE